MTHSMNHQTPFWKLALGGVIAGAAIYFFPFIVPAIAFVFVMGLLFRLFFGFGRWGGPHMRHAYAAHWQSMTEEQRTAMREKFRNHRCGGWQEPAPSNPTTPDTNA